MFLDSLTKIINDRGQKELFLCIRDLVENGLCLDRFTEQERVPGRHEATVFLAAWCRRIGLEPEKYREWLVDYSVQVLSKISSTSLSQIKHSTKSTIKYVHRSEVPFTCYADKNIFKAACSAQCPLYEQMQAEYQRKLEEDRKEQERLQQINQPVEVDPETLPVIKRYKKQYEEALTLIKDYLDQGYMKKEIAGFLNEKGYKTKTGYTWKPGIVSNLSAEKGWSPKRKKAASKSGSA